MVSPVNGPRRIVIRANRETLILVVAACAATFALAVSIHARPPAAAPTTESAQSQQQDWTGDLADVSSGDGETASTAPLTSASLVVPTSELALPSAVSRGRPRSCDSGAACAKVTAAPRTRVVTKIEQARLETRRERNLMSQLNPFNHLPDAATLGRPFTYAGNTISGWFRRL